ncbi:MAG: hypothetical protein Q9169_007317 [Polycauliona sp. 2 TL-2023]
MPPLSSSVTITRLPPPGPSALFLPHSFLSSLALPNPTPLPPPPNVPTAFISALRVRIPVFVTEQDCPLLNEIDADDARSWHWIAFHGDQPVGTLRLVPVSTTNSQEGEEVVIMEKEHVDLHDEEEGGDDRLTEPYHGATKMWDGREPYIKIGRMATLSEYRGRGLAQRLIEESLAWAGMNTKALSSGGDDKSSGVPQWKGLVLSHAQKSVQGWWGKMKFELDEGLGVWWEEGIEHVGMWRRVDAVG